VFVSEEVRVTQRLRIKALIMAIVLSVSTAISVYPIVGAHYGIHSPDWLMDKQLKLGLDLKGGVQLVLRVHTDDALRLETEQALERLRAELEAKQITVGDTTTLSMAQFRIDGVPPAQRAAFRQTASEVDANFTRGAGVDGSYTFSMKPNIQQNLRDEAVVQARETIERRVNELGVTEPSISQQGQSGDQILVQLPGVTDVERAKSVIQSTGLLELKIVEQGPSPTKEALLRNSVVPQGMEIVPGVSGAPGDAGTVYYLVRKAAVVSGRDLRNARPTTDENNLPEVAFTLTADGGRKFGRATGDNIGRSLAIILDGRVVSAARIENRIADEGRIHGSFTVDDAQNISLILRSGALLASQTFLEEKTIGPSLGADAIRSGVFASAAGLLLVLAFMLAHYRWAGVNAVIALIFNLLMLLALMECIGAVMTLPGIAGFVLTMGIGVDSNVLIFERIKEDLAAGHSVRASIDGGFGRVFWTLLDTHIAALISAAFLFQFGTGPIRGFAVTLSAGLVCNLFTSTFVSKTLFELALSHRRRDVRLSI
jgi:preprotein translocase subunit SecD